MEDSHVAVYCTLRSLWFFHQSVKRYKTNISQKLYKLLLWATHMDYRKQIRQMGELCFLLFQYLSLPTSALPGPYIVSTYHFYLLLKKCFFLPGLHLFLYLCHNHLLKMSHYTDIKLHMCKSIIYCKCHPLQNGFPTIQMWNVFAENLRQ